MSTFLGSRAGRPFLCSAGQELPAPPEEAHLDLPKHHNRNSYSRPLRPTVLESSRDQALGPKAKGRAAAGSLVMAAGVTSCFQSELRHHFGGPWQNSLWQMGSGRAKLLTAASGHERRVASVSKLQSCQSFILGSRKVNLFHPQVIYLQPRSREEAGSWSSALCSRCAECGKGKAASGDGAAGAWHSLPSPTGATWGLGISYTPTDKASRSPQAGRKVFIETRGLLPKWSGSRARARSSSLGGPHSKPRRHPEVCQGEGGRWWFPRAL